MTSIFFNRNVPSKEIFVLDQNHLEKCQFFDYVGMTFLSFYSRTYKAGGRGGGGAVMSHLLKVFLSFLLEDKTSAPDDSW